MFTVAWTELEAPARVEGRPARPRPPLVPDNDAEHQEAERGNDGRDRPSQAVESLPPGQGWVFHAGAIQEEPAFSVREMAAIGEPVFASRTSSSMGCLDAIEREIGSRPLSKSAALLAVAVTTTPPPSKVMPCTRTSVQGVSAAAARTAETRLPTVVSAPAPADVNRAAKTWRLVPGPLITEYPATHGMPAPWHDFA